MKGKIMFVDEAPRSSYRWHVLRMKAGSRVELCLLSEKFFAISTHFLRSTVPCPGENCALCDLLPVRGLFYVAVRCESQTMLLEMGSVSASDFEQSTKLFGPGMKAGVVVEVSRRGQKSPLRTEVLRFQESVNACALLTLSQRAMALYRFPGPNPDETIADYERRLRVISRKRNEMLAYQLMKTKQAGV
jgi:hypothetical protein